VAATARDQQPEVTLKGGGQRALTQSIPQGSNEIYHCHNDISGYDSAELSCHLELVVLNQASSHYPHGHHHHGVVVNMKQKTICTEEAVTGSTDQGQTTQ
jgi:hypothetical protein